MCLMWMRLLVETHLEESYVPHVEDEHGGHIDDPQIPTDPGVTSTDRRV